MDKRKFGRAKRSAVYDTLANQDALERVSTRDVYGTQHLERSTIEDPQTMTSRTILAVIFGLVIAFLLYCAICVVGNFSSAFMGGSRSSNTGQTIEQSADVTVESSSDVVDEQLGDTFWDKDVNGAKPLSEAPSTLTMEGLKANYLVYQPADIVTGNTVDCYVDSEGNRYLEGDLPGLLDRVHRHEFMSADKQEIERLKALRAAGPYNILPLNLAPMNITLKDFMYLYFADTNPERASAIRRYYDYDGNVYEHSQIEELWKKVQTGEIGLGRESYLGEDGGYDADGNSVAGGGTVSSGSGSGSGGKSSGGLTPAGLMAISWRPGVFVISMVVGLLAFLILYEILKRNLDAQNAETDVTDINQYPNDQHIQVPEELQRNYDWFPDVGAHSTVMVSGMLSHMMLMNKGLKKVNVTRRAAKDVVDEDGNTLYFKGEPLLDDDDDEIVDVLPIIDEKFGDALFTASGTPNDKRIRKLWDATKIPYNPGNQNREKLKGYDTVADLINGDWEFPSYEVQRPAGAYIVDTEPVNTMVLAITRAGKGQTYIEPTIDMWTRERTPNNMVINDPKGELLVKFYVKAAVRGFQPVQFNLINAMKTDIYNPLMMAAQAAREGDFTKCALYVENIAEVFFPTDGADDPVWPNAANNAFKRAAYGLIDYYVEEEKEERLKAEKTNMDPKVLDGRLDVMWGKVTLYNCYQLFVQLTSKKLKNPFAQFAKDTEAGKFNEGGMQIDPKTGEMIETKRGAEPLTQEEWEERRDECKKDAELWEDKPEIDALTLYFNATAHLPRNQMRNLIANADNALRSMGAAEKMLASVYGIAITAMSFFTDPTISTLTSGTPSQNVDLGGLSFPRRFGVRMHPDFVKRYHLLGLQCKWDAFEDAGFMKKMGKDFVHDDILNREGWAMCYFKGKFPKDIAYLRLRLMNSQTGSLVRTFYFQFKKSYQMSLDSRYYVKDPVLDEKIVKNGILIELKPVKGKNEGEVVYRKAKTLFPQVKVKDVLKGGTKEKVQTPAITQTMVRYSDKPKIIFLVTPPHLMKYAKLILILVKQLVDLNFDKSYMTKSC